MHKYMKRTAAALLAGVFIIGQACPALAAVSYTHLTLPTILLV